MKKADLLENVKSR